MNNKKSTKRALLSSVLSLVICLTMLIGTTFAWFTDSVTSTGNKIQSGNLKVDLLVKGETGYVSVKNDQTPIFDYDLWEPGYVMYKNIQIKNIGTLALKYMMKVVASGEVSILADVIDVYFIDGDVTPSRESLAAMTPVGTLRDILADTNGCIDGTLLAQGNTEGKDVAFKTIAFKMRESAGNDYQGLSIGSKFDIKLLATQLTYEEDSFNNQYDNDASFIPAWDGVTVSEPKQDANGVYHITNGEELAYLNTIISTLRAEQEIKVQLDNDINLGGHNWTPIGVGTNYGQAFVGTFDGNGYTIYNVNVNQNVTTFSMRTAGLENVGFFGCAIKGGTTIKNVILENVTVAGGERTGALLGSGNNVKIMNCRVVNGTVEGSESTNAKVGGMVGTLISSSLTNSSVSNLTVISANEEGIAGGLVGRAQKDGVDPVIKGNSVTGSVVIANTAKEIMGADLVGIDVSSNTEEEVIVVNEPKKIADGLYQDADNAFLVLSGAGLSVLNSDWNTLANRNTVIDILADIDFAGYTWTPLESQADTSMGLKEIDGNGHTIKNLTIKGQAMFKRFAASGNVTIKDITFDNATVNSTAINSSILTVQTYQNVLLDNVDVINSTITGGYKVAPLIATVYNEGSSTVTATLKNCDVTNCVVKATSYDFCTTGMVAFVYADDNDKVEFENCTVTDVTLMAPNDSYKAHAFVYTTGSESLYDEAEGVTVTNCKFEVLK